MPLIMFEDTPHDIVGDPDIENAIWPIGQNVDIAT